MKNDKKTLHLVLKKKWWDMIESGVKTEEYREVKPYYEKRLYRCSRYDEYGRIIKDHYKHYDYVCFHKGYTANTMTFEIESISVGKGKPEWGAPKEDVFIIKLGKVVALEIAHTTSKVEMKKLVDSSDLVFNIGE